MGIIYPAYLARRIMCSSDGLWFSVRKKARFTTALAAGASLVGIRSRSTLGRGLSPIRTKLARCWPIKTYVRPPHKQTLKPSDLNLPDGPNREQPWLCLCASSNNSCRTTLRRRFSCLCLSGGAYPCSCASRCQNCSIFPQPPPPPPATKLRGHPRTQQPKLPRLTPQPSYTHPSYSACLDRTARTEGESAGVSGTGNIGYRLWSRVLAGEAAAFLSFGGRGRRRSGGVRGGELGP